MYGLAVLIQPRNKFTLPTKCISMTPRTTHFSKLPWVGLERTTLCYYLHVFLLLHCTRLQRYRFCSVPYCIQLWLFIEYCRFVFEDQQCRLFYYNSHSDFAPLGYASLIMHVTYYSGTSLLRAVYQFLAYEIRGRDPALVLGPDRKA